MEKHTKYSFVLEQPSHDRRNFHIFFDQTILLIFSDQLKPKLKKNEELVIEVKIKIVYDPTESLDEYHENIFVEALRISSIELFQQFRERMLTFKNNFPIPSGCKRISMKSEIFFSIQKETA